MLHIIFKYLSQYMNSLFKHKKSKNINFIPPLIISRQVDTKKFRYFKDNNIKEEAECLLIQFNNIIFTFFVKYKIDFYSFLVIYKV